MFAFLGSFLQKQLQIISQIFTSNAEESVEGKIAEYHGDTLESGDT